MKIRFTPLLVISVGLMIYRIVLFISEGNLTPLSGIVTAGAGIILLIVYALLRDKYKIGISPSD